MCQNSSPQTSKMTSLDNIFNTLYPQETPVSFKEFVTSPDYCNNQEMYPFWIDTLSSLNDPSELIIDGSLGGGKSTAANFYLLYRLYKLFLIPNLHKYLGVMKTSPIYLLYFSTSMTQARRSGFQHLIDLVDSCKWFTDNFPRQQNLRSEIKFPNGFSIAYASSEGHQLSLNVLGFILDEANFRKGVGIGNESEYEEVTRLYTQLLDRQITRFMKPSGTPSLAILISSASYQSSFLETRKEQVKNNPNAFCITAVSYKIKPEAYSKETFEVFTGTGTLSPCIISSDEHKQLLLNQSGLEGLENNYKNLFIQVPESLRPQFLTNIALALQNHAGIPTQISGRLIQNMELIRESYYQPKLWFPENHITLSNKDDYQLIEFLQKENIEHPERPHSIFLDLSVAGDSGGFSCFRNDSTSEKPFHTHVFTLEIIPPSFPAETQISKIRDFIFELATFVNIENFGSDQYQSKQLRQEILDYLELEDTRLSIDSSDQFFLHWMRSLVEHTSNLIHIPKLQTEMQEAVHNLKTHRVEKSKGSTDDLFQSVVGAYFLSSVYTENIQLPVRDRNVVGSSSVRRILKTLGYE